MEPVNTPNPSTAPSTKQAPASKVVLVYEDPIAQKRAMELWDRVSQLVGSEAARCSSWSLGELSHSHVLVKAAAAAIQAEVIVVALQAGGNLPPGLKAWVEAWLPFRRQQEGALMAILGLDPQPGASSDQVQSYLRAVARQRGLEFLAQEYLVAMEAAPSIPAPLSAGKASTPPFSHHAEA
jgi:hypothetical protein